MQAEKKWIFLALIVVLTVALVSYFGTNNAEVAELIVEAYPQPAKIGFATIKISSTIPLENVFVILPDRAAELDHVEGNTYFFKYFVSPYDEIGLKSIKITALDVNGNQLNDDTNSIYVGYNAAGEKINEVMFYSYDWNAVPKALDLMLWSKINFFFEASPEADDTNSEVINAFIPLVTKLGSKGVNLVTYGVGVNGEEWVSCTEANGTTKLLSDCQNALNERNSVILRFPRYPTTQVFVTNTTVEIQPKLGEVTNATNAVIELLNQENPVVYLSSSEEGNSTELNSSTSL